MRAPHAPREPAPALRAFAPGRRRRRLRVVVVVTAILLAAVAVEEVLALSTFHDAVETRSALNRSAAATAATERLVVDASTVANVAESPGMLAPLDPVLLGRIGADLAYLRAEPLPTSGTILVRLSATTSRLGAAATQDQVRALAVRLLTEATELDGHVRTVAIVPVRDGISSQASNALLLLLLSGIVLVVPGAVLYLQHRSTHGDLRAAHVAMIGALEDARDAHDALTTAHAEAELRSRTDPLTGVANRRHMDDRLARAVADGHRGALLIVDVDHFKAINDEHGHAAGDAVLVELAGRLAGLAGPRDCAARIGGEEFALLVDDVRDAAALVAIAERVRTAIADEPVDALGEDVAVTVSVGAATVRDALARGGGADAVLAAADRSLYAAKRQGRNAVRVGVDTDAVFAAADPDAVAFAETLGAIAELRAGADRAHTREVADLSLQIAHELGLAPRLALRCHVGALLHDVGKAAIPDAILSKPGALDADEWAEMRRHTEIGADIVRCIAALRGAAGVVRHHHERYDGRGYPDGLAADAIPIEARVVAVADAYAAMTADRCYQEARSGAEALAELERCAGTHFDPACVAALRAALADDDAGRRAA